MKITAVNILKRTCNFEKTYQSVERQTNQMDNYGDLERPADYAPPKNAADTLKTGLFIEISTDGGVSGEYGFVESRAELLSIFEGLSACLIGRDPLDNRMLWDMMSRFDRHSRSGIMMMAISALDIALWDLKGKILGQPVYKLLGGGRPKVRPYISALGFSIEAEAAKKKALEIRDMGIRAQKWFFRYGPSEGVAGMRKNLDMAFALREALGEDYELMFDCYMGWNISYARKMFY